MTQGWALFWSGNFQGSKCSTEPWGVLSLPLLPEQLCPVAALCCWSSTEGLQAFSWRHSCRNCLPKSEVSNSNGTEVHLKESRDRMSVMTGCCTCFWGKHYTLFCSVPVLGPVRAAFSGWKSEWEGSELKIGHCKICKLKIDISWCSREQQIHLALGIGKMKLWCAPKCWVAGCRPGVCELQICVAKKLSEFTKYLLYGVFYFADNHFSAT